jgi:hypothetical protein
MANIDAGNGNRPFPPLAQHHLTLPHAFAHLSDKKPVALVVHFCVEIQLFSNFAFLQAID